MHGIMPCAAHRHNALAKYSKEAFMKAFTDALTNQSIHLGSSSRRVSSCSGSNSSNGKSFRSKNTIFCDNLRSENTSSVLFPPCSMALRSNAQVTPLPTTSGCQFNPHGDDEHRDSRNRDTSTITLLTLTAAALPSMLRGIPGRRDTSCSWFGSNRLGILILVAALFP